MKNSTYSRRNDTVSTVVKSHATIPAACWRRNARQVLVVRRGAGSRLVPAERRADRGCGDPHAKPEELALDALVAPGRVLPGQPDDQLLCLLVQRWPTRPTARVGPGVGDQAPVPAQQGLGLHGEARPAGPGQDAADRGKQRPVGELQLGSWNLAAEHRELVRRTRISRSLAASLRASSTSS